MNKTLITSMASGWYKKLIPLFEYTAKKHNPNCDVRVFDKDSMFPGHDNKATGLLRFCVPNECFKGYDFVYFTDVDFIFLHQKPNLIDYYKNNLCGLPYSGIRGRVAFRGRPRWIGDLARMAGGGFLATKKWLEITEERRKIYANNAIEWDKTREHDEIYLQRLCSHAEIPIPRKSRHFYNGKAFDLNYRNIHLGDFKNEFRKRWTKPNRMKRSFLCDKSIGKYMGLCSDAKFLQLRETAMKDPNINEMFQNLKYYLFIR